MDAPKDDGSNQNDPHDTELTDHESNENEPTPGELVNISSPVTSAAGAGPRYALITPSPFEERVHTIFIGPDGLRAIWRFALYLLVYRALHFVLQLLIFYALPDMGQLRLQAFAYFGLAIVALTAAVIMSRIENQRFSVYGLPLRHPAGKLFWAGVLWGMVSLTVLLFALHEVHSFDFGTLALHGWRMAKFAVFWAVLYLAVGIYEEFFTRGYSQFTLTQSLGFWPAAVLLSVGFGALHVQNPGESWVGILGATVIGFFFCLTLRRTGNLWFAVGFHTSWDWGESFIYSVPNSGTMVPGHLLHSRFYGSNWLTGGSVGPEGSVFLFVLIAALWVVFDRVYPEVEYPKQAA